MAFISVIVPLPPYEFFSSGIFDSNKAEGFSGPDVLTKEGIN